MKKFLFYIFLGLSVTVFSQSSCPNLNFSMGNFTGWQCYTSVCDIMDAAQLQNSGQFFDPYCPTIPKVPNGYNFSCRLGYSQYRYSDTIEYALMIDSNNSLLFIYSATLHPDCELTHIYNDRQKLIIYTKDTLNNILPIPCANVDILSDTTLVYMACSPYDGRKWNRIGINLESLIGENIKIQICLRQNASHVGGYVYVVVDCFPSQTYKPTEIQLCKGQVARLSAPEGFNEYTWSRSSDTNWSRTDRQIVVPNPQDEEIFTCKLGTFGCESELKFVIKELSTDAYFTFGVKDGQNNVNFPLHNWENWYDTCNRTATFVDFSPIRNGIKDSILWKIISPSGAVLETSSDSMFTYTFSEPPNNQPETYRVHLTAFASNEGCSEKDTMSQNITIYPSPKVKIEEEKRMCIGDSAWLKAVVIQSEIVSHQWNWTDENNINHTTSGDSIKIYGSGSGIYTLASLDSVGCFARDTIEIQIINPLFTNKFSNDTLCSGRTTKRVVFTGMATIYEWTSTGNISNMPTNSIGNFGEYMLENKGNTLLTDTIIVTPKYVMNVKTCIGAC